MKPRIFIGSSGEGLDVASYIKAELAHYFDCYLWTDGIFKHNKSALETLVQGASYFDFGIIVATNDDSTKTRGTDHITPRDNIIFELGLFYGRLGASKTFLFQEKDSKLPSDMYGITVARFEQKEILKDSVSLNSEILKVKSEIEERYKLGELGLLPSTTLAIGYFQNFISVVCDALMAKKEMTVNGVDYNKFQLNIIKPNELDVDIHRRIKVYSSIHNLQEINIDANTRSFPIHVSFSSSGNGILNLYDLPTTLGGVDKAIELFLGKGFVGKSEEQKLLEKRELYNFYRTLELLIEQDAYAREIVKIIPEK